VRRQPPLAGGGGARVAVDGNAVGLCRDGQRLPGFGGFPLQVLQLANHPGQQGGLVQVFGIHLQTLFGSGKN